MKLIVIRVLVGINHKGSFHKSLRSEHILHLICNFLNALVDLGEYLFHSNVYFHFEGMTAH